MAVRTIQEAGATVTKCPVTVSVHFVIIRIVWRTQPSIVWNPMSIACAKEWIRNKRFQFLPYSQGQHRHRCVE